MNIEDYNSPLFIYYNGWEYLYDYDALDPFEMSEIIYEDGNGDYWNYNESGEFRFSFDSNLIFKL